MAKRLEKELERGKAQFRVSGIVTVKDNTFPEKDEDGNLKETVSEKTGFSYMRAGFFIKANESQSAFVSLFGGHNPSQPEKDVVYATNADTNETTKIKWNLRNNEEVLKPLADWSFVHVQLEKDEDGELIEKKFLSPVDAITYLSEHLKNGMDIRVTGTISYQEYNGEVQRTYNATRIVLNTPNSRGEIEHFAEIRQTYLLDNKSLSKDWEQEIEDKGRTTLSVWVPQYVGGTTKKVLPFAQELVVKLLKNDVDITKKFIKSRFIPNGDVVREINTIDTIVYGVEEGKGQVEFTQEVQDLIDMGFMDKEEVLAADTTNGNRVDEIVFKKPELKNVDGKMCSAMADRYSPEALTFADEEDEVETVVADSDDDLDDLFS